jgi:MFS family permease
MNRPPLRSRPTLLQRVLHEPAPHPRLEKLDSYPWVIVATVCIGAFMGQLDTSIVSLVLPALEERFDTGLNSVQWVAIVYLLVLTGLLTPLGRIADELGRKALYTGGFAVFIVGSALCGFAPNLWTLVAARAVQALGGAMLQANSVALITAAVPPEKLGRAIGVQATAQARGLGASFGVAVVGAAMAVRVGKPTHLRHPAHVLHAFRVAVAVLLASAIAAGLLSIGRHAVRKGVHASDVDLV